MKAHSSIHPGQSVLAITLGLLCLYWYTHQQGYLSAALLVGFSGLLSVRLAGWMHAGWMKLSAALGMIGPAVFLSLIYFLILTPLALLFRLFAKDDMRIRYVPGSLFVKRREQASARSMEKTW